MLILFCSANIFQPKYEKYNSVIIRKKKQEMDSEKESDLREVGYWLKKKNHNCSFKEIVCHVFSKHADFFFDCTYR